jgi:hypothetical protein
MAYDIGKITREIQQSFDLFIPQGVRPEDAPPNKATPENLAVLVGALETLTKEISARRSQLSNWIPDAGIVAWDRAMVAWRERLVNYRTQVDKAPPGDRQDVLWSVTAPLLLGFFGGENSEDPQRPIDAVTPFILANMLAVADDWREQRYRALVADLESGIKSAAAAVGVGLGAAVLVGGAALAWWVLRR